MPFLLNSVSKEIIKNNRIVMKNLILDTCLRMIEHSRFLTFFFSSIQFAMVLQDWSLDHFIQIFFHVLFCIKHNVSIRFFFHENELPFLSYLLIIRYSLIYCLNKTNWLIAIKWQFCIKKKSTSDSFYIHHILLECNVIEKVNILQNFSIW